MGGLCLSGERLALREFAPADEAALHAIVSDPEVTAHTLWGPNEPADTRAFLATAVAQADTPEARVGYHLAAVSRTDDSLLGSVILDIDNVAHARAVVGFVFAPQCWGQGFASEALRLMLDFGFGELRLHRIAVHCHPDHQPCARVLEKAGMTLEGRMRDYKMVRGQWRDSLLYARVRA
jgi:[ribosomal protein S5]-alanine N-acetyltransferase